LQRVWRGGRDLLLEDSAEKERKKKQTKQKNRLFPKKARLIALFFEKNGKKAKNKNKNVLFPLLSTSTRNQQHQSQKHTR